MKKIALFVLTLMLFTGCSVISYNKETLVDNMFKPKNLSNTVSPGYKYYIPKGLVLKGKNDYNETLYSEGNYYYLYVDVVSYYNKVESEYNINNDAYYSKRLDNDGKKGYIEINKIRDKFFIEAMYNYSKIEAYVDEFHINKAIMNSAYVLSSIKFNDVLAEIKLGNTDDKIKEEKLNIFVPKREVGSFLNSLEQDENALEEETGKEE